MESYDNVDKDINKDFQTFLEWQRDRYIFLGEDKEGYKYFVCLNIVNGKYQTLVRIRLSRKNKEGQWETLTKFHVSFWDFGRIVDSLKVVARKALEKQLET